MCARFGKVLVTPSMVAMMMGINYKLGTAWL